MYFETIETMIRRYERTPKKYAFQAETIKGHLVWKEQARVRLREITGIARCEKAGLDARKISDVQMDGYTREYWIITTEPEIQMPFYLLRPRILNGAALLYLHGHGGGKERMAHGDKSAFAEEMVREGFMVFCPDERGSGDRREQFEQGESEEKCRSNSHKELQRVAIGFGQSMVGWCVWDLMRLLDFIETIPEMQDGRIGCAGFSGGGQMTLWLTSLDDRIQAAMTGGYFYGMKDSLIALCNNCSCNYVPFMWETMDMGDMGALIAPRPFFIENGAADPLNGARGLDNVYEQVEITRKAYKLYNAEQHLFHRIHPGAHVWSGVGVKEFFLKYLG